MDKPGVYKSDEIKVDQNLIYDQIISGRLRPSDNLDCLRLSDNLEVNPTTYFSPTDLKAYSTQK